MSEIRIPHYPDIERSVLGGCLLERSLDSADDAGIEANDFHSPSHRTIYKTLRVLHEHGMPVDHIALTEALRESNQLEGVGGPAYIAELIKGSARVSDHEARMLRDARDRYELMQLSESVVNAVSAGALASEVNAIIERGTAEIKARNSTRSSLSVRRLADVLPEHVEFLWHPYIPIGKLTLLEGDPGLGKSWITCALASAVSTGRGLPEMASGVPRNVLMMSAEDGLGDTIRPRLDSMGADVSRIFAVETPVTLDERGMLMIAEPIATYTPVLVIIDPIVAYMGAGVDLHRANETRAVMARLARIAEQQRCAILCVRHLSKGGTSKSIYRGLGSIDMIAAARSSLLVGADPDSPAVRAIAHHKSNLAPAGASVGYSLGADGFHWTGRSDLTAERILSVASDSEEQASRCDAEDFLNDLLATGSCAAKEIQREAREAGISEATLRRAKDVLGIRSRKIGQPGSKQAWHWELPGEDAQSTAEDAQARASEHLRVNDGSKDNYCNNLPEGAHPSVLEHLRDGSEHLRAEAETEEVSTWQRG